MGFFVIKISVLKKNHDFPWNMWVLIIFVLLPLLENKMAIYSKSHENEYIVYWFILLKILSLNIEKVWSKNAFLLVPSESLVTSVFWFLAPSIFLLLYF